MFNRDILLIDTEATGLDVKRHELIQLAAVLLDKKTLKEKAYYASYIRPLKWNNRDPEAMAVNKLTLRDLKGAPSAKQVIAEFDKKFRGKDVILAFYGGMLDIDFIRALYAKLGKKHQFDYHFFNLWPVFYTYLAAKNKLTNRRRFTGFTLEDLMKKFRVKLSGRHDALGDCRVEAEILRKIMKELK
jgi:DNA polymerase III epsilon subunit-like protein